MRIFFCSLFHLLSSLASLTAEHWQTAGSFHASISRKKQIWFIVSNLHISTTDNMTVQNPLAHSSVSYFSNKRLIIPLRSHDPPVLPNICMICLPEYIWMPMILTRNNRSWEKSVWGLIYSEKMSIYSTTLHSQSLMLEFSQIPFTLPMALTFPSLLTFDHPAFFLCLPHHGPWLSNNYHTSYANIFAGLGQGFMPACAHGCTLCVTWGKVWRECGSATVERQLALQVQCLVKDYI